MSRMGYLFIFASVFANALKGYSSKCVSKNIDTSRDAIEINIARSVLCCVIAAVFVLFEQESLALSINLAEFCICLISGVSMAVFVVCWMLAIKTDAYMLVSACASASFILPCIFGIFILNEHFTLYKSLSFATSVIALYFLLRYNFSVKGKLSKISILLLAVILLSQGLNQTMQKMYAHYIVYKDGSYFTLYTFMFTSMLLFPAKGFFKKASPNIEHRRLIKKNMKYILLMSAGLFGTSYFQTLAAARVDAIILYPMVNALSLIAGTTMASLFFNEKISKDCIIGVLFMLSALIFSKI